VHPGLAVRSGYRDLVAVNTLQVTIVYEEGEDGWIVASVPEIPGTHSQGRTREEAKTNVLDALQVMLTPAEDLAPETDREPIVLTIER
jgi:predicted RNase H-like HicB family nuclease